MRVQDNKSAINILLQTLELNPELWETRKKTAEILFDEEQYVEAAEILWTAPDIPSTDVDVAFTIKIISRAKPNRAIRLIYEIVRRNDGKPAKNMAVASALNDIGMYMQAARFYGAALASDPSLFDLGFERQALWLDDSHRLYEEWQKSDHEFKPPLDVPNQEVTGGLLTPADIPENPLQPAQGYNSQVQFAPMPIATQPLAPAAVAVAAPTMQMKRSIAPAAMQPTNADVSYPPTPAPIRHTVEASVPASYSRPALAQAVPTQPLQAAPVKPIEVSSALESEPTPLQTTIGSTTGRLLTPTLSNRPPFKLK